MKPRADKVRKVELKESVGLPELLDTDDVARILRCSRRHVFRLNKEGLMPAAIKLGDLTRWNRKVIESWVESGCKNHLT